MNKEAAEILSKKRDSKGWTQSEMAQKLAVSLKQTYSLRQYQKLEEGFFPKYKKEIVKEIDSILGTRLYELIYDENVPREMVISESEYYRLRHRMIEAEAKLNVLQVTVIELVSILKSKSIALVSSEFSKANAVEIDNVAAEWKIK